MSKLYFVLEKKNDFSCLKTYEVKDATKNTFVRQILKFNPILGEMENVFEEVVGGEDLVFEVFDFENITLSTRLYDLKRKTEYTVSSIDLEINQFVLKTSLGEILTFRSELNSEVNHSFVEIKDNSLEKTFNSIDLGDFFKFLTLASSKNLPEQENPALAVIRRLKRIETKAEELETEAKVVFKEIVRSFNFTKKVSSKLNLGQIEDGYIDSWKELWEKVEELQKRHTL